MRFSHARITFVNPIKSTIKIKHTTSPPLFEGLGRLFTRLLFVFKTKIYLMCQLESQKILNACIFL